MYYDYIITHYTADDPHIQFYGGDAIEVLRYLELLISNTTGLDTCMQFDTIEDALSYIRTKVIGNVANGIMLMIRDDVEHTSYHFNLLSQED